MSDLLETIKWPSPVHEENGQWYFYIETWADREGPFATETEAVDACNSYAHSIGCQ